MCVGLMGMELLFLVVGPDPAKGLGFKTRICLSSLIWEHLKAVHQERLNNFEIPQKSKPFNMFLHMVDCQGACAMT